MALTIVGTVFTVIGVGLSVWSIWYSRQQSKRISNLKRNELISLWASLARLAQSLSDIQKITRDEIFIEDGKINSKQQHILSKLHKGLADQYVRSVELIVIKTPEMTINDVEEWCENKRIGVNNDWRKKQFINMILATNKNQKEQVVYDNELAAD